MDKDLDKLLSYSLDRLDKKETSDFKNKLVADPDLDQDLEEMQIILELIALAEKPMMPSDNVKRSIEATLDVSSPFHGYIERFMRLFDLQRKEVDELFGKLVNKPEEIFSACGIPKTSLYYFNGGPKVADATCGLIKVEANSIFPAHQHTGKEWVLILQGTAIDRSGKAYFPGDTIYSDESVSHALRVGKDRDLIFAVVLEKPNKWLVGQILLDYLFPGRRFRFKG